MTDKAISPLRRRMIEDVAIRKFGQKTQHDYARSVKDFTKFLGHSPGTAKPEDVRRLIACDDKGVTFRCKNYRIKGRHRYKRMTLATDEFIRRFLIHVLPRGFHRIRHYGLLANPACADNIARARALLAVPERQAEPANATDGNDPHPCPHCGGRMIIIDTFEPGSMPRHRRNGPIVAIRIDTS